MKLNPEKSEQSVQYDYNFIILGAGVAGLAFAWKMSKKGKKVLVIEKEAVVGGLSRTLKKKGFYLDFSAHRFHTNNRSLLKNINSLNKLKLYKHRKKSRIFMFNKYLNYPFELPNLFRAMPMNSTIICISSYLFNLLKNKIVNKTAISYKDWFIKYYGAKLYEIMCLPYTLKIWRTDPSFISADWADQRFGVENMKSLLKKAIKKLVSLDFSNYKLEDDAHAPDGGIFYYPEYGIQELPNAFLREIKQQKGSVLCNAQLKFIHKHEHVLNYEYREKSYKVTYQTLISTIPLDILYSLQEYRNKQIGEDLKHNRYMDIIFVYVFLNQKRVSSDHWIYFPDADIPFNRAVEFKNWSRKMAPENKTCLCLDITCYYDDETWNKSDAQITQECIDAGNRIRLFRQENVYGSYVERVRYAYPAYSLDYKQRLKRIVNFLETDDVYLLGRTGIFRYNNADNSVEMAFQLAENFSNNISSKSIFEYKIKNQSL